jgi:hypothetical protein
MANAKSNDRTEALIESVKQQRTVLADAARRRSDLERRIDHYERKYGVASNALRTEIHAGRMRETQEVCHWLIDYDLLRRVKSR